MPLLKPTGHSALASLIAVSALAVAAQACKRMLPASLSDVSTPATVGGFLVDQNSPAKAAVSGMNGSPDAAVVRAIANNAVGVWYVGAASGDVFTKVSSQAAAATAAQATAVMVAYNIPQRDCGGFSAGGTSADQYRTWITQFAQGIGQAKALVVLEPDAVPSADCLSEADRKTRYDLLAFAVAKLKTAPNAKVYIDAGHAQWQTPAEIASRLQQAGIAQADGFALNVSNYIATDTTAAYGRQIKAIVGKGFIVDTSRNGAGDNGEWCNPAGRAIGSISTSTPAVADVDALVWVQLPGSSDGACNGGPNAGVYWTQRAVDLAKAANFTGIPGPDNASSPTLPGAANGAGTPAQTTIAAAGAQAGPAAGTSAQPGSVLSQAITPAGFSMTLSPKSTTAGGYCVDLILQNGTSAPISSWRVRVAQNGAQINLQWNLRYAAAADGSIVFGPTAAWNSLIPVGGTLARQGFCAVLKAGATPASINGYSAS